MFTMVMQSCFLQRRLRLLLDPDTIEGQQSSWNDGTALPTKSYHVGLLLRYNVRGTATVDFTCSSTDAPFIMARYAESSLHYVFEE